MPQYSGCGVLGPGELFVSTRAKAASTRVTSVPSSWPSCAELSRRCSPFDAHVHNPGYQGRQAGSFTVRGCSARSHRSLARSQEDSSCWQGSAEDPGAPAEEGLLTTKGNRRLRAGALHGDPLSQVLFERPRGDGVCVASNDMQALELSLDGCPRFPGFELLQMPGKYSAAPEAIERGGREGII
jgi:hypothetical protein